MESGWGVNYKSIIWGRIRGYGYLEFSSNLTDGFVLLPEFGFGVMLGKYVGNADMAIASGYPSGADVSTFTGLGLSTSVAGITKWGSYDTFGRTTWNGECLGIDSGITLGQVTNFFTSNIPFNLGPIIFNGTDIPNASGMATDTQLLSNFFHQGGWANIYHNCSTYGN